MQLLFICYGGLYFNWSDFCRAKKKPTNHVKLDSSMFLLLTLHWVFPFAVQCSYRAWHPSLLGHKRRAVTFPKYTPLPRWKYNISLVYWGNCSHLITNYLDRKPVTGRKPTTILHSREKFITFLSVSKTSTKTFHHFHFLSSQRSGGESWTPDHFLESRWYNFTTLGNFGSLPVELVFLPWSCPSKP